MLWIIAAVAAAMIAPGAFVRWGPIRLQDPRLMLVVIQIVMFGMGTRMSLADLKGVAQSPRGVAIGIFCNFTLIPIASWALAKAFGFPDEIAAGIVLIGSCPSGLASNVMAYMAGANLALSVTVTAVSTLLAPLLTPLLMKLLAGRFVAVHFFGMMLDIARIVVVPISAALLHDYLKHASKRGWRNAGIAAGVGGAWLLFLALGGWARLSALLAPGPLGLAGLSGFAAGAVLVGIGYHGLLRRRPGFERLMPIASMAGIVYFTAMTTSSGRDYLLKVGFALVLVSIIQNAAGYFLGYWCSRAARLDENSARSVAFEVGLHNGGMASGLAAAMGKLATVGLAPAIFSPWMNVSGSILANYWKRKPKR